jgi:hypothetical protein
MRKLKPLIFICSILTGNCTFAQSKVHAIPKLGIDLQISYTDFAGKDGEVFDPTIRGGGGLFIDIPVNQSLNFHPGLSFDFLGVEENFQLGILKTNLFYINLPLALRYLFAKKFYVEAGVMPGYLARSYHRRSDGYEGGADDYYKKFNTSLLAGLGLKVGSDLHIGIRCTPGLSNIWDWTTGVNVKTFSVGLRGSFTF